MNFMKTTKWLVIFLCVISRKGIIVFLLLQLDMYEYIYISGKWAISIWLHIIYI
jgi:hypothetical protein